MNMNHPRVYVVMEITHNTGAQFSSTLASKNRAIHYYNNGHTNSQLAKKKKKSPFSPELYTAKAVIASSARLNRRRIVHTRFVRVFFFLNSFESKEPIISCTFTMIVFLGHRTGEKIRVYYVYYIFIVFNGWPLGVKATKVTGLTIALTQRTLVFRSFTSVSPINVTVSLCVVSLNAVRFFIC